MNDKIVTCIVDHINQYKYLGHKRVGNNSYLVGQAPHIGPEAWLHIVYAPLCQEEINSLFSSNIPKNIEYIEFLKHMNGLTLFNGVLTFYGLRNNYSRVGDNIYQPFNIITANTIERNLNIDSESLVFGSYRQDGSKLLISKEGHIARFKRENGLILNQWNNFEDFILTEVPRVFSLFNSDGIKINSKLSTTPENDLN